jgi:hypothetical protein
VYGERRRVVKNGHCTHFQNEQKKASEQEKMQQRQNRTTGNSMAMALEVFF